MSISELLHLARVMLFRCAYSLTRRFVDRDMFMRYRGGGVGHKYMRVIEEIFENMSRERLHHQERKRASSSTDATDANDVDSSDDEREPQGSEPTKATEGNGRVDEDDDDDDGSDYEPVEGDSGGSGSSEDSDTYDSDSDGELLETYGLGAL